LVAFPKNINIAKTFHVTTLESMVTLDLFLGCVGLESFESP